MILKPFFHWLAVNWLMNPGDGAKFTAIVAQAKKAGAFGFELVWHALNKMSAMETALALRAGGMLDATLCVFFGEGMGDPLSSDPVQFELAVRNFRQALAFIRELRNHGIRIDFIDGPSCWVLAKDYGVPFSVLNDRIVTFYKAVADDLRATQVTVAIELLRADEDFVFRTVENAIEVIDRLNAEIPGDMFGFHLDVHHLAERGYSIPAAIRALGKRIKYLHLHGTKRRPAGSEGDTMPWAEIIAALEAEGITGLIFAYEPFCQLVRDECPPLGVNLPPAVNEPGGFIQNLATLKDKGVQSIAA